jgi:hypothetical protein
MGGVKVKRGKGQGGGKSAKEMQEEAQAAQDAALISTSCAFCPWRYEGPALEGRAAAKEHRRREHPEAKQTRRRRASLIRRVSTDDNFRTENLARAAKVAASLARLEDAV